MKTFQQLNDLMTVARQCSPYYIHHLAGIKEPIQSLSQLPLTDPVEYWSNSRELNRWPVLTGSLEQAVVFKTGGSTGAGKLSVFSLNEWQTLVSDFGKSLTAQFKPGDRVANLFFAGDLYASFLFIHDALAHVAQDITEFPFTGAVESSVLAETLVQQRVNVLAGLPAHLLVFAAWLRNNGQILNHVDTVLYGGESLFPVQRQILAQVFPNARMASIGYASVDAGYIGTSALDCADGEHRTPDHHVMIEIIDEQSGEVIEDCDRTGMLVVTNLTRQLMPLLRYPVGDRACWREPVGTPLRKYALRGRTANSQRVRVGILSLIPGEIGDIIQHTVGSDVWQLVIEQQAHKDVLSLKWLASEALPSTRTEQQIKTRLIEHYPLIEHLQNEQLLELRIQRSTAEELWRHPRSGKCPRVLDLRVYEHADGAHG